MARTKGTRSPLRTLPRTSTPAVPRCTREGHALPNPQAKPHPRPRDCHPPSGSGKAAFAGGARQHAARLRTEETANRVLVRTAMKQIGLIRSIFLLPMCACAAAHIGAACVCLSYGLPYQLKVSPGQLETFNVTGLYLN